MYRLALMGLCIQDPNIDRERLSQVGLVHDIAEAVVGDIVPSQYSGVSKEEKHKREVDALNSIASLFKSSPSFQREFKSLWYEYENGDTKEGELMKQLDRLEMVVQAYEYERDQRCRLDDFFNSTKDMFTHPEAYAIHQEIIRRRDHLHAIWQAEWIEHGIPMPKPVERTQYKFCSGEALDFKGRIPSIKSLISPTNTHAVSIVVNEEAPTSNSAQVNLELDEEHEKETAPPSESIIAEIQAKRQRQLEAKLEAVRRLQPAAPAAPTSLPLAASRTRAGTLASRTRSPGRGHASATAAEVTTVLPTRRTVMTRSTLTNTTSTTTTRPNSRGSARLVK